MGARGLHNSTQDIDYSLIFCSNLAECRNFVTGLILFYGDVDLRAVVPPVQGDGLAEWYWEV